MKTRNTLFEPSPVCAGTGLLVLDIIINGDKEAAPRLWTGGSCGNVLTILSFLGWRSFPIVRLGRDAAGEKVISDLANFDVQLDYVELEENAKTPIIVEQIKRGPDGSASHRFLKVCPGCGKWLPSYRAIALKKASKLENVLPEMATFYFDRASPGTLELARLARSRGALVVFEPPSAKQEKYFNMAVQLSHLVKYSHENIGDIEYRASDEGPHLVVQTFGAKGLRYLLRKVGTRKGAWQTIEAFEVKQLRDAAGSGDWCTAGLIHLLGQSGAAQLEDASEDEIIHALRFGQALAALNCCFEGARGSMYVLDHRQLERAVTKIMRRHYSECPIKGAAREEKSIRISDVCCNCRKG